MNSGTVSTPRRPAYSLAQPQVPPDSSESNWSAYTRMLGSVTAVSVCIVTVLHQLHCELSNRATHWLVASLLIILSATTFIILASRMLARSNLTGKSSRPTLALGICVVSTALCMFLVEMCDEHFASCAILLGIHAFALATTLRLPTSPQVTAEKVTAAKTAEQSERSSPHATLDSPLGPTQTAESFTETQDRIEPPAAGPIWKTHPGWLLFGTIFGIYMIVVPAIGLIIDWFTPATSGELIDMTLSESLRLHTVSGVVMLIFFSIGASVGSFLNVVIYRLPRSKPLLWPPSACVGCKTKLKGSDNIPVFAWLKLGGKCRYCGVPISARYPIVEAIVGLVFVLFYFRELLSGGANLPVRTPNLYNGIVWILLYTKWDLVTIYLFHMALLVVLFAWGMINHDRFRVPKFSVGLTCLSFLTLASVFPHLNPIIENWTSPVAGLPTSLVASLSGILAGWIVGIGCNWIIPRAEPPVAPQPSHVGANEAPVGDDLPNHNQTEVGESEAEEPDENGPAADGANQSEFGSFSQFTSEPISPDQINSLRDIQTSSTHALTDDGPEAKAPNLYGSLSSRPATSGDVPAMLALVGAAMGVQALFCVLVGSAVLFGLNRMAQSTLRRLKLQQRPLPASLFVFVATTLLLMYWNSVHDHVAKLIGAAA